MSSRRPHIESGGLPRAPRQLAVWPFILILGHSRFPGAYTYLPSEKSSKTPFHSSHSFGTRSRFSLTFSSRLSRLSTHNPIPLFAATRCRYSALTVRSIPIAVVPFQKKHEKILPPQEVDISSQPSRITEPCLCSDFWVSRLSPPP